MRRGIFFFALLLILPLIPVVSSRADIPPEIVKRCKLATGLVRVVDEARGSAFHVGNGLFLTTTYVLRGVGAEPMKIEIMLYSGEKNQKLVPARVAHHASTLGLALLKVDEKELPPALEVGDVSEPVETTQVATFGFPIDKGSAREKGAIFDINVGTGRITALRKSEGILDTIQTDIPANAGIAGGPLVDVKGRIVGVVNTGFRSPDTTSAIPASRVRGFLLNTGIDLSVTPLQFTPGAISTLTVDVGAIRLKEAGIPEPMVIVRLSAGEVDQREYRLTADGKGRYTIRAPLISVVPADDLIAEIEDEGERWAIYVKNQVVQIAGRSVRLADIRSIQQGVAPFVMLENGPRLAGVVTGLKSVACIRNRTPGTVDLSHAPLITFRKPPTFPRDNVRYDVFIYKGAEAIASQRGFLTPEGVRPVTVPPKSSVSSSVGDSPPQNAVWPKVVRWERNGHYYSEVRHPGNILWPEAAKLAATLTHRGKRGHLATVTSKDENDFLIRQFPHPREKGYWLGGFQDKKAPDFKEPKGGWRWITGELWDYENWATNEPDDSNGLSNYLHYFENGKWDDAYFVSEITFGFIVEFE